MRISELEIRAEFGRGAEEKTFRVFSEHRNRLKLVTRTEPTEGSGAREVMTEEKFSFLKLEEHYIKTLRGFGALVYMTYMRQSINIFI
jgi:hypothetical protein